MAERHSFCCSCALVEHGGVRHLHTGKVGDHGLEIDQGFQATLGNLWLIRRISGVPGRVFEDIALHYIGGNGVVITLTNKAAEDFVVGGNFAQFGQCLSFAAAIDYIEGLRHGDGFGNYLTGQFLQAAATQRAEHLLLVVGAGAYMTGDKLSGIFQISQTACLL